MCQIANLPDIRYLADSGYPVRYQVFKITLIIRPYTGYNKKCWIIPDAYLQFVMRYSAI